MSQRHKLVTDEAKLDAVCPLPEVFAIISDKWSVLILNELRPGPRRFTELERAIPAVSRRMLTLTLRNLERNGLLTRTVYPEVPPRVEYQLTSLTDDLIEPLHLLGVWARTNRPRIVAARQSYDSRTAG